MMNAVLLMSIISLAQITANTVPLKRVNVTAPAINCVFSTSCSISVKDTTEEFKLSSGGFGKLRTRTFAGKDGSPAAGLFAYMYRLDLENAVELTAPTCFDSMTISFGPVINTLNYGGDAKPDHVFVIAKGGIGTIGLASAVQTGGSLRFKFQSPVCSGTGPGKGGSTFFWGVVSKKPPTGVTATLHGKNGMKRLVKARSPM